MEKPAINPGKVSWWKYYVGILMSGVSINQVMLIFKHIGLLVIGVRAFFLHQGKFLFPSILKHWENYRSALIEKLRDTEDVHQCGDDRFTQWVIMRNMDVTPGFQIQFLNWFTSNYCRLVYIHCHHCISVVLL